MVGAPVLWSGGKADIPTACRAEQHTAADGGPAAHCRSSAPSQVGGWSAPAAEFER
jgi:hypothetical protein